MSQDNVRSVEMDRDESSSVESPTSEPGLIPEPSMFGAEDFGEFSQDFTWGSGMAVTKFLLAALASVGLTFIFYYFDAHFLVPIMMFGFFIFALSYSLLRANNRVRIICDFFGLLVSVVLQIPGWCV